MMQSKSLHAAAAWARVATAGVALFATAVLGLTSPPSRTAAPPATITVKKGPVVAAPAVALTAESGTEQAAPSMLHVRGPLMIVEVDLPRAKTRLPRPR